MGTWSDFCRELEKAGAFLDRPESPDDEIDRAEGLRYLTRLLRVGLDLTLEFADPRNPALISAQESHFGDGGNTADCVYHHAVIDGRLRYRLLGTRGDAPLVEIGLYDGKIGLDPVSKRIDALTEAELVVDERGEIDVLVGPDLPDGAGPNVLRSDPTTRYLFIRQYAHDWRSTTPATLSLELLDPAPTGVPPLSLAVVEDALDRAARFVQDGSTTTRCSTRLTARCASSSRLAIRTCPTGSTRSATASASWCFVGSARRCQCPSFVPVSCPSRRSKPTDGIPRRRSRSGVRS